MNQITTIIDWIVDRLSQVNRARHLRRRSARVRQRIEVLFEDQKYPKRRRTFKRIRAALGVYDGRDADLKELLFDMGAFPKGGEGDDALWELPLKEVVVEPENKDSGGSHLGKMGIIFGIVAAIVAILTWLEVAPIDIFSKISNFWWPETVEECRRAAINLKEFAECGD